MSLIDAVFKTIVVVVTTLFIAWGTLWVIWDYAGARAERDYYQTHVRPCK